MANKVLLKRSSIAGKAPVSSDLDYGELSINYADGVLYYKNSNNNIGSFLSNGSSFTANSITANTVTTSGNVNIGGNATVASITSTGNITANTGSYFIGDGSRLTGVTSANSGNLVVLSRTGTIRVPILYGNLPLLGRSGTIEIPIAA
jgi:hypothetical protein